MPKAGRLIMLPLRTKAQFPGIPDEVTTLPEVPIGGFLEFPVEGSPVSSPISSPSPTPGPVIPSLPSFNIHDIVGMLPRDNANVPVPATHLKSSITFHWEGGDPIPQMNVDETVAYLQDVARQHIARDWGGGQRGAYVMYHEAIGQNGESYIMHDYTDVVWHSGNNEGNLSSRAILVVCSLATPPTDAQIQAIRKRTVDFAAPVHAHSDWSATQCPGDTIRSVVQSLKNDGFR